MTNPPFLEVNSFHQQYISSDHPFDVYKKHKIDILHFTGLISVCIFFSLLNRNAAIVSFTFGMFNIVFWILTYCQCPFPCDQYEGMCQEPGAVRYFICWDLVLLWTWAGVSVCGLVSD